ncbi:aminoacetone oxidase family FAD-binding enzyme [Rickettsiales bacterium]|nr:aminoacetone oxidase family FAD-binding enzyme [Rickettsiales bacterium]
MSQDYTELHCHYDVIVIGAGAAGLMCAAYAGANNKSVLVLDHNKRIGDKIRISGGGKCNFTNLNISSDNYISKNPHFCRSALAQYQSSDFIDMVKKYNIKFHEKTLGQLFCDTSSKEIINLLISECENNHVKIKSEIKVADVENLEKRFLITTDQNEFACKSLVIATGALSIPKMGATDFGYKIAKQFNIKITETAPALVPFTFNDAYLNETKHLAGVSQFAEVRCGKKMFKEAILFTHRGISGPAILQISSYWQQGDEVLINLLPNHDILNILKAERAKNPKQNIISICAKYLPKKLADFISSQTKVTGFIADLSNKKTSITS